MKKKTFFAFVGPSVLVMLSLIAVPLLGVFYLSLHTSHVKTEIVEVKSVVPPKRGTTLLTSTISVFTWEVCSER